MKGLVRKIRRVLFCRQVEGKEAPGPLFDFGLLMFHCGKTLFEHKSGPFFYLSKVTHVQTYMCSNMLMISFICVCTVILYLQVEGYMEARLWNKIFVWTQQKVCTVCGLYV